MLPASASSSDCRPAVWHHCDTTWRWLQSSALHGHVLAWMLWLPRRHDHVELYSSFSFACPWTSLQRSSCLRSQASMSSGTSTSVNGLTRSLVTFGRRAPQKTASCVDQVFVVHVNHVDLRSPRALGTFPPEALCSMQLSRPQVENSSIHPLRGPVLRRERDLLVRGPVTLIRWPLGRACSGVLCSPARSGARPRAWPILLFLNLW